MKANRMFPWPAAGIVLLVSVGCAADTYTWKTLHLENGLIDLEVVPEIGGRLLQYKLGGHSFFWVNDALENTRPPASGVGPEGEWLNYGGDKLWPAPQGWDHDGQWPGPPDPVLDGGPYEVQVLTGDARPRSIRLASRKDQRCGIQFTREVEIFEDATRVRIAATMRNIDDKPRRWSIWSVTQFDVGNRRGKGYNERFFAFCPLNPESRFYKGYGIQYGPVNNPTFKADPERGLLQVHYQRLVGKAGLDSSAGWVATVDAAEGYAFVHRFTYEPGREYPDGSSVEFWTNGLGDFYAWGRKNTMPEDPGENPHVLESEILSPMASLDPGESYTFHYDWYAARIPENTPVTDSSDMGVTCDPFAAKLENGRLRLAGRYGVFYCGRMELKFLDEDGNAIEHAAPGASVSPVAPVDLSAIPWDKAGLRVPEEAVWAALLIHDREGNALGELARARILR